jgi:hypothetical protein
MKKVIMLFSIVILFTLYLSADTQIPAGNVSGIWEFIGSPFYINGEITIPNSATLNIESGVEVIFTGFYKFNVQGQLLAIGTTILQRSFIVNWNMEKLMEVEKIPVERYLLKIIQKFSFQIQ